MIKRAKLHKVCTILVFILKIKSTINATVFSNEANIKIHT